MREPQILLLRTTADLSQAIADAGSQLLGLAAAFQLPHHISAASLVVVYSIAKGTPVTSAKKQRCFRRVQQ